MNSATLFFLILGISLAFVVSSPIDKFSEIKRELATERSSWKCGVCRATVRALQLFVDLKPSRDCLAALIRFLCKQLRLEDDHVCQATSTEYIDEVLYVLERVILEPKQICGLFYVDCGNPYNPFASTWTLPIPPNKPPVEPWRLPQKGKKKIRVLQLSDLHFDKRYTPGAEADCEEPLCCRRRDGFDAKRPAGYWGTVGICDMPSWTLENLFDHLSKKEKFDYILWTGDLPPHNIWNQSHTDQVSNLEQLGSWFLKYFPQTPIFPAVGNHESAPVDSFAPHTVPSKYGTAWLYETLADQWGHWLPDATKQTIRWRASYSVSPFPGFRIISINTQYGDSLNFWLYLNQTDPDGTLAWLVEELQAAERREEKVHIIGHIPSSSNYLLKRWTWNYYRIVNRFENTIRGQFFGHTHEDSFSIFYDNGKWDGRASGFSFIGPSVTTFTNHHPAYRVYTMDGGYENATWTVLNHETFVFDIEKANRDNVTQWNLEYSAKELYGLDSLFPEDWNRLIDKLDRNETLFREFLTFYHRNKPGMCDRICKRLKLCQLRSSRSYDIESFCPDLLRRDQKSPQDYEDVVSQLEKLIGTVSTGPQFFRGCKNLE